MKKAMIVALAATALLLLNPLPGFARGSQSHGSYSRGPSVHGSYQQGGYGRGGYGGSYQQGSYRHGGYSHGGYRYGGSYGYRHGGYPYGGYRHGGYPNSGYRYGGYPYGGYSYWGYPYRSNAYYSGSVWIGPGWGSWGLGVGWPYYYPYYSYPYYSSPPVVIQQSPTEYIQRDQETDEPDYWYYCRNPEGYYPYVQRCPNGWMKVAPSAVPPDQ